MDLITIARAGAARLGLRPAPLALIFEVTHLCNLSCHYCDRHTPLPNEMTREQIFSVLEQFHELGMRYISLDGGEPLAHRHIGELVSWLVDRGVTVYMNTNGILVPRKLDVVRQLSVVKISLDGPKRNHDSMRGEGSFAKAIAGALAVRQAGVKVEFTCVVGSHNVAEIDPLIDLVESLGLSIVFQPARNSLFLDSDRDGSAFQAEAEALQRAFARIEERKQTSAAIGNAWTSLRHFRSFPQDTSLPCAAGWINATMDPEGNLFHCGQVSRLNRANNVLRLGARVAFERLHRAGCDQCWCARVVEGNYAWGGRGDRMLPPLLPAIRNRLPI